MAASTAPTVKANLITQLEARNGLEGVSVRWAFPAKDDHWPRSKELIYLGDTTSEQEWSSLGPTLPREEHYTLALVVIVNRDGDDPQATEERCWELVAEVEDQLRDDPQVNSAIQRPSREGGYAQFAGASMKVGSSGTESWGAQATVRIAVGARI